MTLSYSENLLLKTLSKFLFKSSFKNINFISTNCKEFQSRKIRLIHERCCRSFGGLTERDAQIKLDAKKKKKDDKEIKRQQKQRDKQ